MPKAGATWRSEVHLLFRRTEHGIGFAFVPGGLLQRRALPGRRAGPGLGGRLTLSQRYSILHIVLAKRLHSPTPQAVNSKSTAGVFLKGGPLPTGP